MNRFSDKTKDRLLALLCALAVLLCALSTLDYDCEWGDDYAAYINQGVALADGTARQQYALNAFLHPSDLSAGMEDGELVYVWGVPLLMAAVYRLFGIDRTGYTIPLWYTLPSVLALALSAAVLVLFFRRRTSRPTAAVLSLLLCLSPAVTEIMDSMYTTDIVLLCLSVLCFYLTELYLERLEDKDHRGRTVFTAVCLGLSLFAAVIVRLNGFTLVLLAACCHAVHFWRTRRAQQPRWWLQLLPYAVLGAAVLLFYRILPWPTSNLGDIGMSDSHAFLRMAQRYAEEFIHCFITFPGVSLPRWGHIALFAAETVLMIWGAVRAFRTSPYFFPYALFLAAAFIIVCTLGYYQGFRYILNLMPLLLAPAGRGLDGLGEKIREHLFHGKVSAANHIAILCSLACCAAFFCGSLSDSFIRVLRGEDVRGEGGGTAYSQASVEVYRWIDENLPEDAEIAFLKPRQLYLATGRIGFSPKASQHADDHADYFLLNYSLYGLSAGSLKGDLADYVADMIPIFDNGSFTLYRTPDCRF